jgi:flagellar basal body-associated protein FliL
MICPHCKKDVPASNLFCGECGKPLPKPEENTKGHTVEHSSEQHSTGGSVSVGDVGMIKDSTIQSETHSDSHNQTTTAVDSHNITETHINMDSHDVHGAPVVGAGGHQTFNFGGDSTMATKTGQHCVICGALAKDNYFRCTSCGRNFLCQKHMVEEHFVCETCARAKFGWKGRKLEAPYPPASQYPPPPTSSYGPTQHYQGPISQPPVDQGPINKTRKDPPKISTVTVVIIVCVILTLGGVGYYFFASKKEIPQPGTSGLQMKQQKDVTRGGGQVTVQPQPTGKSAAPATERKGAATTNPVPQTEKSNEQALNVPLNVEVNIVGQRVSGNDYTQVAVQEGSALKSNDNLQIHVKPSRDCYIYGIIHDSQGIVDLLFPSQAAGVNNHAKGGTTYTIPKNNQWFFLDENTGTETIYIVASVTPMDDISILLDSMRAKNKKQQQEVSTQVIAQVRTRGIGGVTQGPVRHYRTKDGDDIENVTQIASGKGTVVWKLSFKHI